MTGGPAIPERKRRNSPFKRPFRLLFGLAARMAPVQAVAFAGTLGRMAQRLGLYRCSPRAVGALFPHIPTQRHRDIASEIAAESFRVLVIGMVGRGRTMTRLLDPAGIDHLSAAVTTQGGAVLLTWHFGSPVALSFAAEQLPIKVRSFRMKVMPELTSALVTKMKPQGRAATLLEAVRWVRGGGVVGFAPDAPDGTRPVLCPFLGRLVPVQHGAAFIARITGAPLVPALAVWNPRRRIVEIDCSPPVPFADLDPRDPQAFDEELTRRIAAHFEAKARERPWLVSFQFDWYQSLPPAPSRPER
ncbi:MAG TPA: lysophospholipid acyltransferase family protein [Thermoanaerobaculia bacterium]|nr:lysophospholipid acyltransferase family protein [Thermoanaerobaculia bacterium]